MPSLPIATDFTGAGVTEAGFKTAITNQREFLAGLLGTTGNQIDALVTLGALGADTVAKTSGYTVLTTDRGKVILCNGTFTLSLTAAATLADGFNFAVINTGTGTITIDPNSTEQIDGANTKSIGAGGWAVISCTGTAFWTMGTVPATGSLIGYQVFTASGTYTKGTNNPSFVIVEVVGGGGGSGGSTGGGGTGGTSSFGIHCSATGGAGSPAFGQSADGGVGGTGSSGDINLSGGGGGGAISTSTTVGISGAGGNSVFSGGGAGRTLSSALSGAANTGGGAGGAKSTTLTSGSGGGGGGGYSRKKILASALAASETVTVGGSGSAGSGGQPGAAGGTGVVIVWEYR